MNVILMIGAVNTGATCCACGKGYSEHAGEHLESMGGCGAIFTHAAPQAQSDAERVRELRKDLTFVPNPSGLSADELRIAFDAECVDEAADVAYSIGYQFGLMDWDIDDSAPLITALEAFALKNRRAASDLLDTLIAHDTKSVANKTTTTEEI